ncbi:MAG: hypothetical protein FWG20_00335 [Candidatus Cloacimonetes bacterium]|nr:hypothetical protein [Candidatus Cloacimonadota bacterium]
MNRIVFAIQLLRLARILAKFVRSQKAAETEIKGENRGEQRLEYVLEKAEEFLAENEKDLAENIGFRELSELAFRTFTTREV